MKRLDLSLRFGLIALAMGAGCLTMLGFFPALLPAIHLAIPSVIFATSIAWIIEGGLFVMHFVPAAVFGAVYPQASASNLAAFPDSTASEVITPFLQDTLLYDSLTQTTTAFSTADQAFGQAIANLNAQGNGGEIRMRAGAYSFQAQKNIPNNVSVIAERGVTVTAAPGYGGTPLAQFTLVPIFVLGINSDLIGVTEIAGTSNQSLVQTATSPSTTRTTITQNVIVTQVQIPLISNEYPSGISIVSNVFNAAGNIAISSGSSSPLFAAPGSLIIEGNHFIAVTGTILTTIGSNLVPTPPNVTGLDGNMLFNSNIILLESSFPTGGAVIVLNYSNNINIVGNYVNMQYEGNSYPSNPIFLQYSGVSLRAADNLILCLSSSSGGSTTTNGIAFQIISNSNYSRFHFFGNMFQAESGAKGSTATGYFLTATATGTDGDFNEVICQGNIVIGCCINHYYLQQGTSALATLTQGHTITISGNYSNRCGQDNIDIEPNSESFGDIHILDNHLTDYNWSNSSSPIYAGIAINRGNSGWVYGPVFIDNNSMMSSDGNESQIGIFVQGNVYQLCISGRNTAFVQGIGGNTNPPVSNNSIFGNTFKIPGSITTLAYPATATPVVNQTSCDADLVIAGGTLTAIAVNGVTTGLLRAYPETCHS